MNDILRIVITVIGSVLASSGFWSWIQSRREKKDVRNDMLVGLAHDRILYLGMIYIARGWITQDEYENLHDYLYVPYSKMGGNGSAARIMNEIEHIKIVPNDYKEEK